MIAWTLSYCYDSSINFDLQLNITSYDYYGQTIIGAASGEITTISGAEGFTISGKKDRRITNIYFVISKSSEIGKEFQSPFFIDIYVFIWEALYKLVFYDFQK